LQDYTPVAHFEPQNLRARLTIRKTYILLWRNASWYTTECVFGH
jgi:hypothetical protein